MSREAEKKRLVRLIEEAHKKSAEAIHEHIMDTLKTKGRFNSKTDADRQSIYEIEADYLLENGAIVPPCKIGQTVYRIVKMSTGVTTAIRAIRKEGKITGVIKPCEPTIKQFIRSVTVTKNNFIDCCENFGKTVFASEAEAKYALKNRRSVSLVNGHIEE